MKWIIVVSYWNSTSNHNCRGGGKVGLKLYLIEILHQTTTPFAPSLPPARCILLKFYIKPQPLQWHPVEIFGCILLKFYIKPQHCPRPLPRTPGCILLKFYIKPQHSALTISILLSCILLKFYIKPQLRLERELTRCVVSYWNSTSNHNLYPVRIDFIKLYLIEILHQTTTNQENHQREQMLYLIEILHQTTT